jgi:hypothetical protein
MENNLDDILELKLALMDARVTCTNMINTWIMIFFNPFSKCVKFGV